jgi:hypothetical protein
MRLKFTFYFTSEGARAYVFFFSFKRKMRRGEKSRGPPAQNFILNISDIPLFKVEILLEIEVLNS